MLYEQESRGIKNVRLARESLRYPAIIPLLFGNMIVGYENNGKSYTLSVSKGENFTIVPFNRRQLRKNMIGFKIKSVTAEAFPVSMRNALVLVQLIPVSQNYGKMNIWILRRCTWRKRNRLRLRLFAKSLLQDMGDNCQRMLGVRKCGHNPTVSGLCNNRESPHSGSTLYELMSPIKLKRPSTKQLIEAQPSTRYVSNRIFAYNEHKNAPDNVNVLMVFFGQFIDHEITQTPAEGHDENAKAPVQNEAGLANMSFTRSAVLRYDYSQSSNSGYSNKNIQDGSPFNSITSFIDGGAIYGSNNLRANTLRLFKKGKMIMKGPKKSLLPMNRKAHLHFKLDNEPGTDNPSLFVAGDHRANENVVLLAIHTIFIREHNRVAKLLRKWVRRKGSYRLLENDEWLFRTAKKIVIAQMQIITFEEFVPAMMGENSLKPYTHYQPNVDARISIFHSSFAYRWGHSSVPESMEVSDVKGKSSTISLRDMFFNTKMFLGHGVDNLLISAMNTPAEDVDEQLVDSIRDFLFNPRRKGVLDLGALNIQRTRDLGIPPYLELQKIYKTGSGLNNIKPELRDRLLKVYGKADKIDSFVGGLCEDKVPGSLLGPLFHAINVDQFARLRDGDRFYYKNMRWPKVVQDMPLVQRIQEGNIRFRDIVFANTDLGIDQVGSRSSMFRTQ